MWVEHPDVVLVDKQTTPTMNKDTFKHKKNCCLTFFFLSFHLSCSFASLVALVLLIYVDPSLFFFALMDNYFHLQES